MMHTTQGHTQICQTLKYTKNYSVKLKNKNHLDATYYFIVLLIGLTCFGLYYAHHQGLATALQPGHHSSLTAPNLQLTANQERNDQCGNQHYNRELLMMGIVVPETC